MTHFEHIFSNPTQKNLSYFDQILSDRRGWFTDPSSTARVHPFFNKAIFSDVEVNDEAEESFADHPIHDDLYDQLRPALRLASAMLEECRDYWAFILKAPIYYDTETNIECFESDFINLGLRSYWLEVDRELDLMSQNTQICWIESNYDNSDDGFTYGLTTAIYKPLLPAGQHKLRFRMAVSNLLFLALGNPDFNSKPFHEQCTLHVLIAVTLVHELAHCLYQHRQRDYLAEKSKEDGQVPDLPEPLVDAVPNDELGYLFESFLLGGAFNAGCLQKNSTGQQQFDLSKGLNVLVYPPDDADLPVRCKISLATIMMLLHEETWRPDLLMPMYLPPDPESIDAILNRIIRRGS